MWWVDVEDDVAKVGDGEAEHEGGDANAKHHLQDKIDSWQMLIWQSE